MIYIIVDLEATCWEKRNGRKNEIIEIGAISVDEEKNILGEFEQIIKPKLNPVLSGFCTQLTSISQNMVDGGIPFPEALAAFQNWIYQFDTDYFLCSWGFYDRNQFAHDCNLHGLNIHWLKNHISIKHQYAEINAPMKPTGMKKALRREKMELEGTHHRGIDDAKNITKIFIKYFDKWRFE